MKQLKQVRDRLEHSFVRFGHPPKWPKFMGWYLETQKWQFWATEKGPSDQFNRSQKLSSVIWRCLLPIVTIWDHLKCSALQYEHVRNLILGYFRFSIKDVTNCSDCQNDSQNGHQTKHSTSNRLFRHAQVTKLGFCAPQNTVTSFLAFRPTPESWNSAFLTVNHTNKHAAFPFRAYCLRSRSTYNLS